MLRDDIEGQLTTAMKAKDAERVSTLRMLRASMKNHAIDKGVKDLDDEAVMEIVGREVKKLRDSLADFEKGGREDLATGVRKEIEILSAFLPQQLTEDEIRTVVKERAAALGLTEPAAFGRLMGESMKALKGRADGNAVTKIVKETLAGTPA